MKNETVTIYLVTPTNLLKGIQKIDDVKDTQSHFTKHDKVSGRTTLFSKSNAFLRRREAVRYWQKLKKDKTAILLSNAARLESMEQTILLPAG